MKTDHDGPPMLPLVRADGEMITVNVLADFSYQEKLYAAVRDDITQSVMLYEYVHDEHGSVTLGNIPDEAYDGIADYYTGHCLPMMAEEEQSDQGIDEFPVIEVTDKAHHSFQIKPIYFFQMNGWHYTAAVRLDPEPDGSNAILLYRCSFDSQKIEIRSIPSDFEFDAVNSYFTEKILPEILKETGM